MATLSTPNRLPQRHGALKSGAGDDTRSLTPAAGLALLRKLSQELQAAQSESDLATAKSTGSEVIAALFAQRAAALLEYADYDTCATLPLDALSCSSDASTEQQTEADERRAQVLVLAVQQAQEDAAKSLALAPGRVEGYFLSAQCFRSSGMLDDAGRMIASAVKMLPGNTQIAQLAREIAVERANTQQATQTRFPAVATTSQSLSASTTNDLSHLAISETQHEGDNNDEGDGSNHRAAWQRIASEFGPLRAISESPELARLEHMMHHNVHHQCASASNARYLEHALKSVVSFLLAVLRSCRVLGMDIDAHPFEQILKPKLERADWHHLLIQDRLARKWLAHTLVPSTRFAPTSLDSEPSTGMTLLRDVLLLLTRVLLAVGGWRRCTAMPHALVYAELSHDLAKELASSSFSPSPAASSSTVQGLTRLEMACSDGYGLALRDLLSDLGEALALHQDGLETAVLTKDRAYELRGHHLVGQALLRMKEPVLAQAEFMQLLVQSQEEGDAAMEALARFELGESCVQRGELDDALVHLRYARTICNQTGSCTGTWRSQSVHRAIAFYAALRPAKRRDAVMCASAFTLKRMENGDVSLPVRRPGLLVEESSLSQVEGEKHVEPQQDAISCQGKTTSVVSKLFASESLRLGGNFQDAKPVSTAKPRRRGGWRDSVFAAPPSSLSSRPSSDSNSSSSSSSQYSCSPSSSSSDTGSAATSATVSVSSVGAAVNYTSRQAAVDDYDEMQSYCVVPAQRSKEGEDVSGPHHASL